tara:strand:+ start:398 stop:616 length:219 start_codon:yes stop_codon:yes gene_type:complete
MEILIAFLIACVVIVAVNGIAFFKWGSSSSKKEEAENELDVQEAISNALAKPAPRGLGLRNWVRRNRDDPGS